MLQSLRKTRGHQSSELLKQQLLEDGYLFLPGALDPATPVAAHAAVLEICHRAGLSRAREDSRVSSDLARMPVEQRKELVENCRLAWMATQAYEAIFQDPSLRALVAHATGGPIVPHPRRLARHGRIVLPRTLLRAMAPHQDIFYLKLPEQTFSTWICTAPCAVEDGGLALVPGSHRAGPLPHRGQRERVTIPRGHAGWHTADYQPGDVLLFHSCTIHGPLPNRSLERLRVVVDFRFCRRDLFDPAVLAHPRFGQFD